MLDSIGGANGVLRSTPAGSVPSYDGSKVTLDGAGGYVDLPNRMLSGLNNVTFEFWVTYSSGGTWARLLDFGFNANAVPNGEDTDGTLGGAQGSNYVFITLEPGPRFAITPASNGNENQVNATTAVTPGTDERHVVVTYGPARTPSIYIDGNFAGSGAYTHPLSVITNDVNCWLGRSQWADPFFGGSFNEFRMHSTQLGQLEVLASRAAGPNTVNYTPENPTAITSLNIVSNMTSGQSQDVTITVRVPDLRNVNCRRFGNQHHFLLFRRGSGWGEQSSDRSSSRHRHHHGCSRWANKLWHHHRCSSGGGDKSAQAPLQLQ